MAIKAGQHLLHYRLIEKIGEGGMGVIWKAKDTALDRDVAIKVLPEVVAADPERLTRFEREAKLLASLGHPNIAAVYGLHEAGGRRFLAMEYVPGEDLARRLARGPLPVEEALAIARQVAEALETAHASGVSCQGTSTFTRLGDTIFYDPAVSLRFTFATWVSLRFRVPPARRAGSALFEPRARLLQQLLQVA